MFPIPTSDLYSAQTDARLARRDPGAPQHRLVLPDPLRARSRDAGQRRATSQAGQQYRVQAHHSVERRRRSAVGRDAADVHQWPRAERAARFETASGRRRAPVQLGDAVDFIQRVRPARVFSAPVWHGIADQRTHRRQEAAVRPPRPFNIANYLFFVSIAVISFYLKVRIIYLYSMQCARETFPVHWSCRTRT